MVWWGAKALSQNLKAAIWPEQSRAAYGTLQNIRIATYTTLNSDHLWNLGVEMVDTVLDKQVQERLIISEQSSEVFVLKQEMRGMLCCKISSSVEAGGSEEVAQQESQTLPDCWEHLTGKVHWAARAACQGTGQKLQHWETTVREMEKRAKKKEQESSKSLWSMLHKNKRSKMDMKMVKVAGC